MPLQQQPGFFEGLGRSADQGVNKVSNAVSQTIDKGKQKITEAKNAVSEGIKSSIRAIDNKANQAKNWLSGKITELENTYRSVSNSVKEGIKNGLNSIRTNFNKLIEGGSRAIDAGKEWAKNQIIALDQALKQLDQAVKNGVLRGIKYVAETGTLIIYAGKEIIKYSINKIKQEMNSLKLAITAKAIEGVKFAKEAGMLVLKAGGKLIKVSITIAAAVGFVVYKGGELFVDAAKTRINRAFKMGRDAWIKVENDFNSAVTSGRKLGAELLRDTADILEPKASHLYAQEK